MGFNPRDLQKMQQQLLRAQAQAQQAQEEAARSLAALTVQGSAGGGVVTVSISGDWQVKAVKLDPDAVDPQDVATLEDLIMAALNDAVTQVVKAQEAAQDKIQASATAGLNLPKGFGL